MLADRPNTGQAAGDAHEDLGLIGDDRPEDLCAPSRREDRARMSEHTSRPVGDDTAPAENSAWAAR
jgi:hypothetical protein